MAVELNSAGGADRLDQRTSAARRHGLEFVYRHVVGFEDTNLIGNVYFARHISWQGRCREMFLLEKAPEILDELANGLRLVTVRCSCDYYAELEPFDAIEIRMKLKHCMQSRLILEFEYFRITPGPEQLFAHGEQEVACLRVMNGELQPVALPPALKQALIPYGGVKPYGGPS